MRNKGDLNKPLEYAKKLISIKPWSIIGEYCCNHRMKLNSSHN